MSIPTNTSPPSTFESSAKDLVPHVNAEGPIRPARPMLIAFCLVIIAIGTMLRLTNIDSKPIWCDEANTLVTIKEGDGVGAIPNQLTSTGGVGHLIEIRKRLDVPHFFRQVKFQRSPNAPLYFFLSRLWAEHFGNTARSARTLSALISLAQLPCVFWLAAELFGCASIAYVCTALCAISPLHLAYGQEARPYSLWTLTIVLGTALLVRALRINSGGSWVLYGLSQVIGFYTHPASAILTATHGAAVLVAARNRLRPFLITAVTAMLACAPWVFWNGADVSRDHMRLFHNWSSKPTTFIDLSMGWMRAIALGFADYNDKLAAWWNYAVQWTLAGLGIFAMCYLGKRAASPTRFVIPILCAGYFLAVVAIDLIMGGYKSAVPRYMIPLTIGAQIAVAFLLVRQFAATSTAKRVWSLALAGALVVAGVSSCLVFSQAETWWVKELEDDVQLAGYLEEGTGSPLWICTRTQSALVTAPMVQPGIPLMIVNDGKLLPSAGTQSRIIVSSGSKSFADRVAAVFGLKAEPCPGTRDGWLLK